MKASSDDFEVVVTLVLYLAKEHHHVLVALLNVVLLRFEALPNDLAERGAEKLRILLRWSLRRGVMLGLRMTKEEAQEEPQDADERERDRSELLIV